MSSQRKGLIRETRRRQSMKIYTHVDTFIYLRAFLFEKLLFVRKRKQIIEIAYDKLNKLIFILKNAE